MRSHRLHPLAAALVVCASVVLSIPGEARAQYKNNSFGFDGAIWMPIRQSPLNEDGKDILSLDKRPLRLSRGGRLGGETNFKMSDHWWFTARVNLGMFFVGHYDEPKGLQENYDVAAAELDPVFGIEGGMGARYVILTDRFRPYVQVGLSYLRLQSFTSKAEETCDGTLVGCASGTNYADAFLPHPNIGGVHLQPGAEIVVKRDLALHFFIDAQYWITWTTAGNFAVVGGIGILFFT